MSVTRGGKRKGKLFEWTYDDGAQRIATRNQDGRMHEFSLEEVRNVLVELQSRFGTQFFPLANDVARLGKLGSKGEERWGLGRVILELSPERAAAVNHAQGSSYLGVVLEECGYFQWNGRHRGIEWRLISTDFSTEALANRLKRKRQ